MQERRLILVFCDSRRVTILKTLEQMLIYPITLEKKCQNRVSKTDISTSTRLNAEFN